MIIRKALRKIFVTSLSLFIILTVYIIQNINSLNANSNNDIKYVNNIGTNYVYLQDKNNYLVKTKIVIDKKTNIEKIKYIINYLTIDNYNYYYPNGLFGTIPKNTKLLDIKIDNNILYLDFSSEFNDASISSIQSIVFSLMDLNILDGIIIKVDNQIIHNRYNLPEKLDKKIGINIKYDINNRNSIDKVVLYYIESIDDINYFVPVTKYINNSDEKIKVIINNLTTNYIYDSNLISLINKDLKINKYSLEEEIMTIDFNNSIFDNMGELDEEVIYSLAYSIFDNYDIKELILTNNDKKIVGFNRENIDKSCKISD